MECHCMCHLSFKGKPMAMHCMPCCSYCPTCDKNITFESWDKHQQEHLEKVQPA